MPVDVDGTCAFRACAVGRIRIANHVGPCSNHNGAGVLENIGSNRARIGDIANEYALRRIAFYAAEHLACLCHVANKSMCWHATRLEPLINSRAGLARRADDEHRFIVAGGEVDEDERKQGARPS